MSQRVLATAQGLDCIRQIEALIHQLQSEVPTLKRLLQTLSDPNVWDGGLALQFRGQVAPTASRAMDQVIQQLETLRGHAQQITTEIMAAGGSR